MVFPLFIIPITTLLFINFINYLFRIKSPFNKFTVYFSSLALITKISTLLSMHINLAYSIIL